MRKFFLVLSILCVHELAASLAQAESICYGSRASGRLEKGETLPRSGPNFRSYSDIGWLAGRTFVHSKVNRVVVNGYKALQSIQPQKKFVYGETGWKQGGKFKPHKTHQNGLSVDLMVPVVERKSGFSVYMPTSVFNKWGYDIEFDRNGFYKDISIDFEALAHLIEQIHKAAIDESIGIEQVIFDPLLISKLHSTSQGNFIRKNIKIPNKKSWVRHDEHIHIDFHIKCQPL